jgi:hypothetical protein
MFRLFGTHYVAVGSVDPIQGWMLSSNETHYTFIGKENYTKPTDDGSNYFLVRLEISFGYSPSDIGWVLFVGEEQTTRTAASRQEDVLWKVSISTYLDRTHHMDLI